MDVTATGAYSASLYPSAKAQPEIGGNTNVVATIEMTPIHELKPEPTIAVITNSPQNPVPLHQQEKLGSKCCGCCCDYRRAVIIVNSLFIGLGVFLILLRDEADKLIQETYDDDAFVDEVSMIIDDYYKKRSILLGVGLGTAVLAQAGAVYFNIWLVGLHSVWMVADYIMFMMLVMQFEEDLQDPYESVGAEPASPVPSFILNAVIVACFLYPHLAFIIEVRNGIMTRETYAREEYSCCCAERRPLAYALPQAQGVPMQHVTPHLQGAPPQVAVQDSSTRL